MGLVVTIWLLQWGVVFVVALSRADMGGFLARLKAAVLRPAVAMLATGCIAFLYAAVHATGNRDAIGAAFAAVSFLLELLLLIGTVLRALFRRFGGRDFTFGSAEFATAEHAASHGLVGQTGIRLGSLRGAVAADGGPLPLHYTGERHLLTVAPTRSGKGVSTIIPNLLTYPGSCLVVDPKGENAMLTAERRSKIGRVCVLDPWGVTGKPSARFNPLDLLRPDSPTLIEDATLIAEALVVQEADGNARHFSEQASDLIKGYLLYLATTPGEVATLGRLRAMLTGLESEQVKIAKAMARSSHPIVTAAVAQMLGRNEKEWLSTVSTAQRNTHFLDSPALQANLGASDFRFADLKGDPPLSIYLVLPIDRLSSHARRLRLIVGMGIVSMARTTVKPKRPVLFMLDEFAALGRMPVIEDAYGLMAGMGLQMHAIVQDLSQLERLYGAGWQTFVGNAGAIQVFGTRDLMTASYFSQLIGQSTQSVRSTSSTTGSTSGSGTQPGSTNSSSSVSFAPAARPLLFPDELMRMDRNAQIVLVENANPCLSDKIVWHEEPAYLALAGASAKALPR